MTAPPIGSAESRFRLESHTKDGAYVCSLPYRNLQGEWLLNERGAQLRGDIPFRGYKQITRANLKEAVHEIWLYDNLVSTVDPIFRGPLWNIVASSDSGVLNFSAQDALSYLAKRLIYSTLTYSNNSVGGVLSGLVTWTNSVQDTLIVPTIKRSSSVLTYRQFKGLDCRKILDVMQEVADGSDRGEFYVRQLNGVQYLNIFGQGGIANTPLLYASDYGGSLDGYSVQYSGEKAVTSFRAIGPNGRIGTANDTAAQTLYGARYQEAGSYDQTSTTTLDASAAAYIAKYKNTKIYPTFVTKKIIPIRDFDFGDRFVVAINDEYVQVSTQFRVTGWQLTVGQADNTTVVVYSKDTEGVS